MNTPLPHPASHGAPLDFSNLVKDLPPLVPAKAAAAFLGVTTRTLRRWASTGRIRVMKTAAGGSGRVLVPRSEIERILEEMLKPTPFD